MYSPPPNGSPEEIQAWNNMMDTMVVFVNASTNLMNVITKKVKTNSPGTGGATDTEAEGGAAATGGRKKCNCAKLRAKREQEKLAIAGGDKKCGCPKSADKKEEEIADDKTAKDGRSKCVCAEIRANRAKDDTQPRDGQICGNQEEDNIEPEEKPELICACGPTPGNQDAQFDEMMVKLSKAQEEIMQLQEEMARLKRMDASKRIGPHAGPNPAAIYKEIMKDSDLGSSQRLRPSPYSRQQYGSPNSTMNTSISGSGNSAYLPCDSFSGRSVPPNQRSRPLQNVRQRLFMDSSMESTNVTRTPPNRVFFPPDDSSRGSGGSSCKPSCRGDRSGASTMITSTPLIQPQSSALASRPSQSFYSGNSRTSSSTGGQSPGYNRSPASYSGTPDQNNWGRMPDYGNSSTPVERIVCPGQTAQQSPPRRRIICGPPPSSDCDDCSPD